MKLNKILLAGVLLMLPLLCQAQKNIFNTYNDMKGVSSVYISKAMIEMNPNLFTKDIYIGKVSGKLESVQIVSTMDNNIKKDLRKDLRTLVQSSKYELLMKQKGNVSSSEFYINRKGDKVKELIMIHRLHHRDHGGHRQGHAHEDHLPAPDRGHGPHGAQRFSARRLGQPHGAGEGRQGTRKNRLPLPHQRPENRA